MAAIPASQNAQGARINTLNMLANSSPITHLLLANLLKAGGTAVSIYERRMRRELNLIFWGHMGRLPSSHSCFAVCAAFLHIEGRTCSLRQWGEGSVTPVLCQCNDLGREHQMVSQSHSEDPIRYHFNMSFVVQRQEGAPGWHGRLSV